MTIKQHFVQFEFISNVNIRQFSNNGDYGKPFQFDVKELLEAGYPVLIYAGDKDYICNWLGQVAWTENLEWTGQDDFKEAQMRPWNVNGQKAGEVKSAKGLTFMRVYEAGHMGMYKYTIL